MLFFYSDNNIDTNTKIIYFKKNLLARLISHYYSDTLSGTDSEIEVYMDNEFEVYMDNEFEGTVERFINIDKIEKCINYIVQEMVRCISYK